MADPVNPNQQKPLTDEEKVKQFLTNVYKKSSTGLSGKVRTNTYLYNDTASQRIKGVTEKTDLKNLTFVAWEEKEPEELKKEVKRHTYEKENILNYQRPKKDNVAGIGSLAIHSEMLTEDDIKADFEFGKVLHDYDGFKPYTSKLVNDLNLLEDTLVEDLSDAPYLPDTEKESFHYQLCYGRLKPEIAYGSMFFIKLDPTAWRSTTSQVKSVRWEGDAEWNKYIVYNRSWDNELNCEVVTFRTNDDPSLIPYDFWDTNESIPVTITLIATDKKGVEGKEVFNIKLVKPMVFGLVSRIGQKTGINVDMKAEQDWSESVGGRHWHLRYINRDPKALDLVMWRPAFRYSPGISNIPKKFVYLHDLNNVIELQDEIYIGNHETKTHYDLVDVKGKVHHLRRPAHNTELEMTSQQKSVYGWNASGNSSQDSIFDLTSPNTNAMGNIKEGTGPAILQFERIFRALPQGQQYYYVTNLPFLKDGMGSIVYNPTQGKFYVLGSAMGSNFSPYTCKTSIILNLEQKYIFRIIVSDVFADGNVYIRPQYTEEGAEAWLDIFTEEEIKQAKVGQWKTDATTQIKFSIQRPNVKSMFSGGGVWMPEVENSALVYKSAPRTNKTLDEFNNFPLDYFNFAELEVNQKGVNLHSQPRSVDTEFDSDKQSSWMGVATSTGYAGAENGAYADINPHYAQNICEGFINAPEMIYDLENERWILPRSKLTQFLDKENGLPFSHDYRRMVKIDPRLQANANVKDLKQRSSVVQDSLNYEFKFQGLGKKPKLVRPDGVEWNSRENYMYDTFCYYPRYHQINCDVVTRNAVNNTSTRWRIELISMGKFKVNPQSLINELVPILNGNEKVDSVETYELDVSAIHSQVGKTIGSAKIKLDPDKSKIEVYSRAHRAFRARNGSANDYTERFLTGYWVSSYGAQIKKAGWDKFGELITDGYQPTTLNMSSSGATPQQVTKEMIAGEGFDACVTGGAPIKYEAGRRPQVLINGNDFNSEMWVRLAKNRFHFKPQTLKDNDIWTNIAGVKPSGLLDVDLQMVKIEYGGAEALGAGTYKVRTNNNVAIYDALLAPGNTKYTGVIQSTMTTFLSAGGNTIEYRSPKGGTGSVEYAIDTAVAQNSGKFTSIRHHCHPTILYEYFNYTKDTAGAALGKAAVGQTAGADGSLNANNGQPQFQSWRGVEIPHSYCNGEAFSSEISYLETTTQTHARYYSPFGSIGTEYIQNPRALASYVKMHERTENPKLNGGSLSGFTAFKPGTYYPAHIAANSGAEKTLRTTAAGFYAGSIHRTDLTKPDDAITEGNYSTSLSAPNHRNGNGAEFANMINNNGSNSVAYVSLVIPDEFGAFSFCPYLISFADNDTFNPGKNFTADFRHQERYFDNDLTVKDDVGDPSGKYEPSQSGQGNQNPNTGTDQQPEQGNGSGEGQGETNPEQGTGGTTTDQSGTPATK